MALKEKENLLVGVIMGSFLPSPQKTELIEIVRNAAAKEREPETRGDQLRAMSDEELARFLIEADQGNFTVDVCDERYCTPENDKCPHDCTNAIIKWLQSPLKEGTT